MKKTAKKLFLLLAVVVMVMVCFAFSSQAAIDWGNAVYISQYGQVVNSITYNGVTVNAIYAPRNQVSNYDSDGTFCCAAFVKKFYSSVFGVGVNNLIPGNTPNVYSGGGYFYKTSSPQVGDIAASSGHWAIVKEVSGSTITLVEQNAWNSSYTSAMVNRKLILPESSYWFWRWSGNPSSGNNTTSSYFTALWHSGVSDNDARIDATINLTYIQNCGFYIGTSSDNMQRIDEVTNANVKNIWFNIKDYYGSLYSGTTYYYKIYIVVNGVEYCSQVQSFTTTGPQIEMSYPTITFDKKSYTVGDKVSFSWEKTNANADFYQYWVIVQNITTGKSYYGGATGDAGDVSKNTLSFFADEEGEYKITVYSVPYNNKEQRQKADVKYINVSKMHTHTYSSSITKVASCSSEGVKTFKCSCGYSYTETIAKKAHTYKTTTTKATLTKNGKVETKCSVCGVVSKSTTIYYPKTITLSKTEYTYNGKAQKPTVTVKDSKGNTLKEDTDYTVTYEKGRKNPGKYSVRIDFMGKYSGTKRVYFTIAPATPVITKTAQTTNAIRLTWNKVTGATGYRVYQYNSKTKKWDKLKTLKDTTYRIEKLKAGTTYKFRVKAYKKDDGTIWGKATATITVATKLPAPTGIKTAQNTSAINLTWNKVAGADGYRVYMYNASTKKWVNQKTLTATSLMVKNLKAGTTYKFKIIAYKKVSGKAIWGDYTAVINASTRTVTPKITAVASTAKGRAAVAWSNVAGESGYELWASTKKDTGYKKIVTAKANVTKGVRTGLVSGRTYYFKVRTFRTVGNTTVYSTFSAANALKIK